MREWSRGRGGSNEGVVEGGGSNEGVVEWGGGREFFGIIFIKTFVSTESGESKLTLFLLVYMFHHFSNMTL